MVYCLNPQCVRPENNDDQRFCPTCGSVLRLGDRYRALKPLGENQGRHTFLAVDQQDLDQKYCILKQITLATSDALTQVIEVFRVLGRHPQIPRLLGVFATEPRIVNFRPTLIQQWVSGTSLESQTWDGEKIHSLLKEVLSLLHWVHSQGVLHRDINPQNLLWNERGQLMLIDFSLAKVTQKVTMARTGTVVGSAAYTAPEQLRGKATATSDLYSLGLVCVHLLTGFHPFDLMGSLGGLKTWPDYLSPPIDPVLQRVLNRLITEAPSDRFPDAAATYAALTGGEDIPLLEPPQTQASSTIITPTHRGWHCVKTLGGYDSALQAVAVHPRLPIIATAGDRTVEQRWLNDAGAKFMGQGHRSLVTTLVFHEPTDTLVSGSWDYTLRRWQQGVEVYCYEGHTGWVNALALSPDAQILASGSADRTVRLWDVVSGDEQHVLTGHKDAVASLAFNENGTLLASGSADQQIRLWQIPTGEISQVLEGHSAAIAALCWSPTGHLLYSGDRAGVIRVWQVATGQRLTEIAAHEGEIHGLAIAPDGNWLLSASDDHTLKVWHPSTGRCVQTLTDHRAPVRAVAYHPVLEQFVTVSQDKTVKLWALGA